MERKLISEVKVVTTIRVYEDGFVEEHIDKFVSDVNKCLTGKIVQTHTIKDADVKSARINLSSKSELSARLLHDLRLYGNVIGIVIMPNQHKFTGTLYNPNGNVIRIHGVSTLYYDYGVNVGDCLKLTYDNRVLCIEKDM